MLSFLYHLAALVTFVGLVAWIALVIYGFLFGLLDSLADKKPRKRE